MQTLRRRKSVQAHTARAYRDARLDLEPALTRDWYFGSPRERADQRPANDDDGSPPEGRLPSSFEQALLDLIDTRFELQARTSAIAIPPGRLRPEAPIQPLSEWQWPVVDAAADTAGLEQQLLQWMDDVLLRPLEICDALRSDVTELAALRRLCANFDLISRDTWLEPWHDEVYAGLPGTPPRQWALRRDHWVRLIALVVLSYPFWLRPLSAWRGGDGLSLLNHVLAGYELPPALNTWLLLGADSGVFLRRLPEAGTAGAAWDRACAVPVLWWMARASGCSAQRVLKSFGLPLPAGLVHALDAVPMAMLDAGVQIEAGEVLTCAEVVRQGGTPEDLARLQQVTDFGKYPGTPYASLGTELFQASVAWVIRHRAQLSDDECADILIWARDQARERQGRQAAGQTFSWAGRTPRSALAAVQERRRAQRPPEGDNVHWARQGWDWREQGPAQWPGVWRVDELSSAHALHWAGVAQDHCVGTYAERCAAGRSAIFRLSCDGRTRLTIEVDPGTRCVLQMRGRYNSRAMAPDTLALNRWVAVMDLSIDIDAV